MGGMTRLLLLLWAGVTVGSVVDLQKRIIGGEACPEEERGYHAYLTFTKGNLMAPCGGSLIDKQWILTAAHCWKEGWTVKVVLGPHTDKPTTVDIELTETFEDKDDKTKKHDIMLLKLKKTTDVEHVQRPDCANKPKKGEPVQIAGYYAKIKPGDEHGPGQRDYSKPLQCANTKVVKCEFNRCPAANDPYMQPLEQLLCFQDEKEKVDATGGDSGGGLVFNKMIYGVIVSGNAYACGGAGQAMDVCKDIYKEWISETIAAKSSG